MTPEMQCLLSIPSDILYEFVIKHTNQQHFLDQPFSERPQ